MQKAHLLIVVNMCMKVEVNPTHILEVGEVAKIVNGRTDAQSDYYSAAQAMS